jgi:hypothetical protein
MTKILEMKKVKTNIKQSRARIFEKKSDELNFSLNPKLLLFFQKNIIKYQIISVFRNKTLQIQEFVQKVL